MPTTNSNASFFAVKTNRVLDEVNTKYLKLQACDENTKLYKALKHAKYTADNLSSYNVSDPNAETFAEHETIAPILRKLIWQLACLYSKSIKSLQDGFKNAPTSHEEKINKLWNTLLNHLFFDYSVFTKKNLIEQYLQTGDFSDATIETLRKSLMEFSFCDDDSTQALKILLAKSTHEYVSLYYMLLMLGIIGFIVSLGILCIGLSACIASAVMFGNVWSALLVLGGLTFLFADIGAITSLALTLFFGISYGCEPEDNKKLAASQLEVVKDAHVDLSHFIERMAEYYTNKFENKHYENQDAPKDPVRYRITVKIPDRSVLQFFDAPIALINQCNAVDTFCDDLRTFLCPKIELNNQNISL